MRIPSWIKWSFFIIVALISLLALAIAAENYRGRKAWLSYKAAEEAKGERFDLASLAPAPVPDDQNFAMTPLLAPLLDYQMDPKTKAVTWRDTNAVERPKNLFGWRRHLESGSKGSWRTAEFMNLAAWQKALREQTNSVIPPMKALLATPAGKPEADLLFLLNQNAAELGEISAAARRPHMRFNIHYDEVFNLLLPELAVLKNFASAYQIKALAELAAGDAEAAVADVRTCLALADTVKSEPLLISGLVRIALLEISIQPLWEGLARHQWNEAQLQQLQTLYGRVNLPEDMLRSLHGERAFELAALDMMRRDPVALGATGDPSSTIEPVRYMPSGWFYQNQLNIARMFKAYVFPAFDPTNRTVDLKRSEQLGREFDQRIRTRSVYSIFAAMLMPAGFRTAEKTVRAQATMDLATVACALERFRLGEGQYPETVNALVPRFLDKIPPDLVTGEPLQYRREGDRFVLYSVGLNRKDDGGTVARDRKGAPQPDKPEGDWVWRYAEK